MALIGQGASFDLKPRRHHLVGAWVETNLVAVIDPDLGDGFRVNLSARPRRVIRRVAVSRMVDLVGERLNVHGAMHVRFVVEDQAALLVRASDNARPLGHRGPCRRPLARDIDPDRELACGLRTGWALAHSARAYASLFQGVNLVLGDVAVRSPWRHKAPFASDSYSMTRYSDRETSLRSTISALSAYAVADAATEALRYVLADCRLDSYQGDGEPPAGWWRKKAMLYIAVMAVRASRTAMAVIASGYEPEALPHQRRLMELHGRMQRVRGDESGSYAKEWLRARAGKPARAVSGMAPSNLWESLSHASHADHRAVENFLAITGGGEDGLHGLVIDPERRPELSNPTLAVVAGESRDIAQALADEFGLKVPGLSDLDGAISQLPPYVEGGN